MNIGDIQVKKGVKLRPEMLKRLGFKKLSRETYFNGDVKVVMKGRKIIKVCGKPQFSQLINGFKGSGGNSSYANEVLKCMR